MACRLCRSENIATRYRLPSIDISRCRECGLLFLGESRVDTRPESQYDRGYYEGRSAYYFDNSVVDPESGVEDETIKDFRRGLDMIESLRPPGRVLDIGCAMGIFLAIAAERKWECCGVDVSPYAIERARSNFGERFHPPVQFFSGRLKDAGFQDGAFDLVTMWDSLEHIEDPVEELREVRRIMKDDGILLFDTPNADSLMRLFAHWIYRMSGGTVRYPVGRLYHPYHMSYFSRNTIELMLARAGLRTYRFETKTIPLVKARAGRMGKYLVRALSQLERACGREYELFVLAVKEESPR